MYKLRRRPQIISTYIDKYGVTYGFLRQGFECRPYVKFDANGVALLDYSVYNYTANLNLEYNIGSICEYALENILLYEMTSEMSYLTRFMIQIDWLVRMKQERKSALCWEITYDYADVKSPWVSGMINGLAISCLTKAYLYTNDTSYLTYASAAADFYDIDVSNGGFTTSFGDQQIFFQQYTNCAEWRRYGLNGFLVSILGLLDLNRMTGTTRVQDLLDRSITYLKGHIHLWESKGIWTNLYRSEVGVSKSIDYHIFHSELMYAIAAMTGDGDLYKIYDNWASIEPETALAIVENHDKYKNSDCFEIIDLMIPEQIVKSLQIHCRNQNDNRTRSGITYGFIKRLMTKGDSSCDC
ncbi:MAG: D-glucuronyl C5-epimerase family protein [Acidobacteriota bacterium]